jgi:hypothetical protein
MTDNKTETTKIETPVQEKGTLESVTETISSTFGGLSGYYSEYYGAARVRIFCIN